MFYILLCFRFGIYFYFNFVLYLLILILNLYTKNILNQVIELGLIRLYHIGP